MKKTTSGFTIVELLIVIVVIAILASITVTAYTGIQQRAINSKVYSVADGYAQILKLYKVDQGSYPPTGLSAGLYACLAPAGSLPATADFSVNECDSVWGDSLSPSLNALLAPYVSALPNGSYPPLAYDPSGFENISRAIVYFRNTTNTQRAEIVYYLKGDSDCPGGTKDLYYTGFTYCTLTLQ